MAQAWVGYDHGGALEQAGRIYDTIDALLKRSKESGQRPEVVAARLV